MDIFLVGGAVRDKLMGYPAGDCDYVVVGASPQKMLELGFEPVGKDFPVFLHPQSKEEYALARTERKTAPGYNGFQFHCDQSVSLEDDLKRRDLTINAMAESAEGEIIDPYGGRRDLEQKLLRHVSAAFAEDPVRILRTARFAARYHHLGFRIAPETLSLMQSMVASGEVDALVAERVWKEMSRALCERSPQIFIQTLRDCGALERLMPELDALFGIEQPARYHPEIDCGIHTLMVLEQAAALTAETDTESALNIRFASLMHDLGKGTTPADILPGHKGHEQRSLPLIEQLCERLAIPKAPRDLALLVAEYHGKVHRTKLLDARERYQIIKASDALRRPQKLQQLLIACMADARGRSGFEQSDYPQRDKLLRALAACQTVNTKTLIAEGFQGKALGEAIEHRRIEAIAEDIKSHD